MTLISFQLTLYNSRKEGTINQAIILTFILVVAVKQELNNVSNDKETETMLDREVRGPSSKAKRLIISASFATVLLGIFMVVGMHYTSQPNFCASCHQISPSVVSWSEGPHKDVTCLKCHADPGTVGMSSAKSLD